jgi:hypothetical protein
MEPPRPRQITGFFAHEFRHHTVQVAAPHQEMPVAAVGVQQIIALFQSRA